MVTSMAGVSGNLPLWPFFLGLQRKLLFLSGGQRLSGTTLPGLSPAPKLKAFCSLSPAPLAETPRWPTALLATLRAAIASSMGHQTHSHQHHHLPCCGAFSYSHAYR